jgi:hypothetical protein
MALSVDTPRIYELGTINSVPVKASVKIYEGSAVGMTSGYARALAAGDDFAGFAERQADNSAVAVDGNIRCRVITKGLIRVTLASIAVTDIGKQVYASDDGTFTLTQGSNSFIGTVYRYVTTDTCIVAFTAVGAADSPIAAGAALASTYLLVGNSSNVAVARAITGDVTIGNTGATAIGNGKVTETMLESATESKLLSYAKSFVSSHVTSSAH